MGWMQTGKHLYVACSLKPAMLTNATRAKAVYRFGGSPLRSLQSTGETLMS